MEALNIIKTSSTPKVDFEMNGQLCIEGRSICEDPLKFFSPLVTWVSDLTAESVNLVIKLDYLNTASTKMMNELIKTMDANMNIGQKAVQWYFESDDEDMVEVGQIIEERTLATDFFFHEMADANFSA